MADRAGQPPQGAAGRGASGVVREAVRSQEFWLLVALAGMCTVFSLRVPGFFHLATLRSVALQTAVEGIIAVGMTMVIISGGIDLSVGSVLGAAGVTATLLMQRGVPIPVAATLVLGVLVGGFNGCLVAYVRIPPFIVTLAMLSMARGYAMLLTNSQTVREYPKGFNAVGGALLLGIPVPVWVLAAVFAAGYVVMRHTRFGRHVYAVGGNAEAARLAGVRVRRTLIGVYCAISALAALAGTINAGRLGAGDPTEGQGAELNVIAAVVLGGTSLMGGEGSLLGTLIGAFVIGFLHKGLGLQGVNYFWQLVVIGGVILAAVALNQIRRSLR